MAQDETEFVTIAPMRFQKHGPVVLPVKLIMEEGSGDVGLVSGNDIEDAMLTIDAIISIS